MIPLFRLAGKYTASNILGLAAERLARPALSALKPTENIIAQGKTVLHPLGELATLPGNPNTQMLRPLGRMPTAPGIETPKPLSPEYLNILTKKR